jgi:hypothetical protein
VTIRELDAIFARSRMGDGTCPTTFAHSAPMIVMIGCD